MISDWNPSNFQEINRIQPVNDELEDELEEQEADHNRTDKICNKTDKYADVKIENPRRPKGDIHVYTGYRQSLTCGLVECQETHMFTQNLKK